MSTRTPIIAANWKMYKDHLEAIQLVQQFAYHLKEEDYDGQHIVICPPFTALRSVQTLIHADKLPMLLGAQNVHTDASGAFTGEISAAMLARLDTAYVLVGHSERRMYNAETDAVVNAKARAVLAAGMHAIVCVGEMLDDRRANNHIKVVLDQLHASVAQLSFTDPEALVIAYEPVWAIGSGETATSQDAQEMASAIRSELAQIFDQAAADAIRIQYGGSVKPGNIRSILAQDDIDGALVGGASLSAEDFALIVAHRRL
ncbi:MAG: triose-phosphate isomerase [Nitriliruptoraceae bacterium]